MSRSKIAISLDPKVLDQLDRLVTDRAFASRSQAIEHAVVEKLNRLGRGRLARECAKLNPRVERSIAEEGSILEESPWPEY